MITATYAAAGVLLALTALLFVSGILTALTQTIAFAIVRSRLGRPYVFGAVLMLIAAGFEAWLGVAAERRALEDVAPPLSILED